MISPDGNTLQIVAMPGTVLAVLLACLAALAVIVTVAVRSAFKARRYEAPAESEDPFEQMAVDEIVRHELGADSDAFHAPKEEQKAA